MTTTARDVLAAARELADDLLFPDAMRVDGLDVLPAAHLDALAAAGLYGAPVPVQAGGLGLDLAEYCAVVEVLAGGCLATTFVWLQHRGVVMMLAAEGTPAALREDLDHAYYDIRSQDEHRTREILETQHGVLAVQPTGAKLRLYVDERATSAEELAAVTPFTWQRVAPSLEDVFIALVREEEVARAA